MNSPTNFKIVLQSVERCCSKDMVLQVAAPEACKPVRQQMDALKLFLASELAMQSVLMSPGEPTKATAPQKSTPASSAGITSALKTCWQLSPSLASALALRYPAEKDAHAALQSLTVAHAAQPVTRTWPQGALQYADACCSKVCCSVSVGLSWENANPRGVGR